MSRSGHIYDITPEDFNAMVLENSFKGLVLVYFWSHNVGPCMKLLPNLIRLADEFSGRFLLNLLDRAKKLLLQGQAINAAALLNSLSREALETPEIGLVKAHVDLIRAAQLSPERQVIVKRIEDDPRDFQSIYQLAALNLVSDDYESACESLMSIRNQSRDSSLVDQATRSIIAVFALLGESHPLVERFSDILNQSDSTD